MTVLLNQEHECLELLLVAAQSDHLRHINIHIQGELVVEIILRSFIISF